MDIISGWFASPCEWKGEQNDSLQKQIQMLTGDNEGLLQKLKKLSNELYIAKQQTMEHQKVEMNLFETGDIVKLFGIKSQNDWNGKIATVVAPFQTATKQWPLQFISDIDNGKKETVQLETKYMQFYRKKDDDIILSKKKTPKYFENEHTKIFRESARTTREEKEKGITLKLLHDYESDVIFEIDSDDKKIKYNYNIEKIGFKNGTVKDVSIYLGGEHEWILLRNIKNIRKSEFVKYYSIDDNISIQKKVESKMNKIKIQILRSYNGTKQEETTYYFKIFSLATFSYGNER